MSSEFARLGLTVGVTPFPSAAAPTHRQGEVQRHRALYRVTVRDELGILLRFADAIEWLVVGQEGLVGVASDTTTALMHRQLRTSDVRLLPLPPSLMALDYQWLTEFSRQIGPLRDAQILSRERTLAYLGHGHEGSPWVQYTDTWHRAFEAPDLSSALSAPLSLFPGLRLPRHMEAMVLSEELEALTERHTASNAGHSRAANCGYCEAPWPCPSWSYGDHGAAARLPQ